MLSVYKRLKTIVTETVGPADILAERNADILAERNADILAERKTFLLDCFLAILKRFLQ